MSAYYLYLNIINIFINIHLQIIPMVFELPFAFLDMRVCVKSKNRQMCC